MVFPLLMIVSGVGDVLSMRIPNRLIIAIAAAFLPLALATGMPMWLLGMNAATALILLAIGFALFSFGLIGGGDAKLMAASGLWLGFPCVLMFILMSALAGGVLAAAMGLMSIVRMEAGARSARLDNLFAALSPDVPYGFALASGAILTTPFSWWMIAATAQS